MRFLNSAPTPVSAALRPEFGERFLKTNKKSGLSEAARRRAGGEGGAAVATGEHIPSRGYGCACGSASPGADLAKKSTGQPGEVRAGSRQGKTTGEGNPRGRDGSSGRGGGREGGPGGA